MAIKFNTFYVYDKELTEHHQFETLAQVLEKKESKAKIIAEVLTGSSSSSSSSMSEDYLDISSYFLPKIAGIVALILVIGFFGFAVIPSLMEESTKKLDEAMEMVTEAEQEPVQQVEPNTYLGLEGVDFSFYSNNAGLTGLDVKNALESYNDLTLAVLVEDTFEKGISNAPILEIGGVKYLNFNSCLEDVNYFTTDKETNEIAYYRNIDEIVSKIDENDLYYSTLLKSKSSTVIGIVFTQKTY